MDGRSVEEREYEAIATVRDVLLLLCSEIGDDPKDCPRLRAAYEFMDRLMAEAGRQI